MESLTQRYEKQIAGTLSCFDRVVITGTLPDICHKEALARHLYFKDIRIFDYAKVFAEPLREEIRTNTERVAEEAGVEIEYLSSPRRIRKEARVQAVLEQRPVEERHQPGLVHIFSVMEPCDAFKPWRDKATGHCYLRTAASKCIHYYFYFIDPEFGLCYLRVPTWAPFRLQFYCNGHNWLANQLRQRDIAFQQLDNTFGSIADWPKAQELADEFPVDQLHRLLDAAAMRFCPVLRHFQAGYHWSIMQVEYATDIVFKRQDDLRPLYEGLVHTAIHAVKPDHVATFLGRKLHPNFESELGNDFHTRIEGTRIKHFMGPTSLKMYDKAGLVLRLETTTNDVTFFKHYREVEHRDGQVEKKMAAVQKTIYSLGVLRELLGAANRRYLDFLSDLSDPTAGVRKVEKLSQTVQHDERTYRGFNLFDADDLALFSAIARGEWQISGMANATLRRVLPDKTGPQVSRLLKRLRLHGLIKKVGHCYKYYLTKFGQEVTLTALKLRELVVIPSLAGALPS
jgi:hypothetical protein